MTYDDIVKTIDKKMDEEINLFNSSFDLILSKVVKRIEIEAVLIDDPLEFDLVVQRILEEEGYFNLVNNLIDESYDKNYVEILKLFELGGLLTSYSNQDMQELQALKELDIDFFTSLGNDTANRLKADIYKYNVSNLTNEEIVENISKSLKDTPLAKYSKTYAETSLSNYHQSVIDLKATDLPNEVWIYQGKKPDSKIRDFCKCLMNNPKYYDKKTANIIKRDNRRKYNCRHYLSPVSRQWAERNGYVEGKFTC